MIVVSVCVISVVRAWGSRNAPFALLPALGARNRVHRIGHNDQACSLSRKDMESPLQWSVALG